MIADVFGLDEFWLRLPTLLAGAALLFLPLLLRPSLDRSAAAGVTWLLAVSPLLIYFSRYARPYSISLLLASLAAIAFYRWWVGGRRTWMAFYLIGAAAGVYFHLSVVFFALAPFLFALPARRLSGSGRPTRSVLAWGGATGALLMALLLPPLVHRADAVLGKLAAGAPNGDTIDGALKLMAGSRHTWVAVLLAVLATVGARSLWKRFPRPFLYVSALCAVQLSGVALTAPASLSAPNVLARYSLPVLGVLLLAAAQGLATLEVLAKRRLSRFPEGISAVLMGGVLLAAGPLPSQDYHPNNWTNHALFNYTYDLRDPRYSYYPGTLPLRVSAFYKGLADRPSESLLLLEAPWYGDWPCNAFPHDQYLHRQRMMVGFVSEPEEELRFGGFRADDRHLRFRSFVYLGDWQAVFASGADYAVLHKHLGAETDTGCSPVEMSRWIARYRDRLGVPAFEDDDLAVFDLQAAAPPEPSE